MEDPPDQYTMRAAIALALRAPSVHNSQPWSWRLTERTVELHADTARRLHRADPSGRNLLVSCGCALHHLRVAAAALGWAAHVRHLPVPDDPDLLATVELVRAEPADADIALAAAIPRRRSDRRRFSNRPLTPATLELITAATLAEGISVRFADRGGPRTALLLAAEAARGLHRADRDYLVELAAWTGRRCSADGVPTRNSPLVVNAPHELGARDFSAEFPAQTPGGVVDGAALAVVATPSDTRLDQLRAGEAASAMLLTATRLELATCLVTEPLELPSTRGLIRDCVLGDGLEPQLVLRIGYLPAGAAPLPATPRRPLADVVDSPTTSGAAGLPLTPGRHRR